MLTSNRTTNILLVLLIATGIGIVAMLASGVRGGPLDPPAPPASTMRTLDDVDTSWDRRLNATNGAPSGSLSPPQGCDSDRFRCVLRTQQCTLVCITNFPAVLDVETGLVWERSDSGVALAYSAAVSRCAGLSAGDRGGWRLPTKEEFYSVRDPIAGDLPAGSPFTGFAAGERFWTSSVPVGTPDARFGITIGGSFLSMALTNTIGVWCVRGPVVGQQSS